MKRLELIHKEENEECFEILKSTIVEDKELRKYRIDKNTLLKELPAEIVNDFLDFIGSDEQHRSLMLHMIKTGSLIIYCWEDEDDRASVIHHTPNYKDRLVNEKHKDSFRHRPDYNIPF